MAKKINGITIAINADTNGVTAGLKDLTAESISLSKQLKTVDSLLQIDPENVELAATKQELLAKAVDASKRRLEALKAAQQDVQAAVARGDIGTDEYIAFQRELVTTEKRLKDLEKQEDDTGTETEELAESTENAGTEMEKAEKHSGKLGEALKEGVKKGAEVAAAAVTAMAAAASAAVAGIVNAAGATAEYGDNIDKMSQKLGMSSDAYQEWDFIMQHSGSDIDKMTTSMKKLAEEVQEPTEKSTAAFEKLGISIEQAKNMSQEDLFSATITALQSMESGTERTALATDLLGKSAMDLGALLNTSAEETEAMRQQVHELGGVMDEEAVGTAAAYQDSLQNVKTAISGVTRSIGADFMPSMIQIMNSVSQIAMGNLNAIKGAELGVDRFVDTIGKTAQKLTQTAQRILPVIVDAISKMLPSLLNAGLEIVKSLGSAILRNLPMLLRTAQTIIMNLASALLGELPRLIRVGLGVIAELAKGIADALPTLVPTIIDIALEIVDILTDPDTLSTLIDASIAIVIALTDGIIDSLPKLIERLPELVDQLVNGIIDNLDKLLDAAVQVVEQFAGYLFNPENADKIVTAGMEIITKIVKGLGDALWEITKKVMEIAHEIADKLGIGEYWEAGQKVIDDFMNGVKAKWDEWTGWWEDIGERIYDWLHPDFSGDSMIDESSVWYPQVPAMATGGIVRHPTRALIGENGAEIVLPLERNTGWMDQLAARINAGGATGGIRIDTITVNVTGTEQTGRAVVEQIDNALRQYQIQQQRGIGGTGW